MHDGAQRMAERDGGPEVDAKRVQAIRDEMKFEIGILHDRVNALVSAEAFLIISFTMALAYSGEGPSGRFFSVAPLLAAVGFLLAVLAWPGVNRGVAIVVEWNLLLIDALKGAHQSTSPATRGRRPGTATACCSRASCRRSSPSPGCCWPRSCCPRRCGTREATRGGA